MGRKIFDHATGLDSDFLEAVYEHDLETAVSIFRQYLHDLPADIQSFEESFRKGDRQQFASLIHKKKVGFSYVGLTDVTNRFSELEARCASATELQGFSAEFQSIIDRIRTSEGVVKDMFNRLQQQESL